MSSSIGLAATRQLVATALGTSSARAVVLRQFAGRTGNTSRFSFKIVRTYAAAAAAKRTTTAKASKTSTAAKKPAAKKTTTTAKKTTKAKAATKTKPKSKLKAKSKAKPKAAKRKPSEETLLTRERRALKKTALFSEPKTLSEHPWSLFIAEHTKGQSIAVEEMQGMFKRLSEEYKALPASQLQRLKTLAQQNKVTNAAAQKAWVETHTPEEVVAAINARKKLKSKFNYPKGSIKMIRDDRIPKRAVTAFLMFSKARWASGDMKGVGNITESAKSLGQEWKSMSESERQPYFDLAKTDMIRYEKDVASQLNRKVTHG